MIRRNWKLALVLMLATGSWLISTALDAQVKGQDPNITLMDNCSDEDPAWNGVGGCPEDAPFPGASAYSGDVTVAEFFSLLFSPLAPGGQVIGHPSWRMQPSYASIGEGQTVRVHNQGGRTHTFTEVEDFGGGFVPPLNGALIPAPECDPAEVTFVPHGQTQTLQGLDSGLHKFQCCIHPWMRSAVRVK